MNGNFLKYLIFSENSKNNILYKLLIMAILMNLKSINMKFLRIFVIISL